MSPGKNKAAKDKNIEVYCPKLVLDAMGVEPLADRERDRMLNWWLADVRPTYERWGPSSCNWDGMLDAVWLLHHPSLVIEDVRPVAKWTRWLHMQLGHEEPREGEPEALRYLHGRETASNTYEAMRWGAVLAVQWWCEREMRKVADKVGEAMAGTKHNPRGTVLRSERLKAAAPVSELSALLQLCREYTLVNCALFALGAAPGPARNFQANRRGQFYFNGPWLGQAGQRSTMAHVGQDDRACIFALAVGWDGLVSKREGPWARVARAAWSGKAPLLGFDWTRGAIAEHPERTLERVRTWTPLHFLRWGTGSDQVVVSYTTHRRNRLTGNVMASGWCNGVGAVLYPWPARIRKGGQGGYCYHDEERNLIIAGSTDDRNNRGRKEQWFEVPASPPDFEAVIDANGYRRLR